MKIDSQSSISSKFVNLNHHNNKPHNRQLRVFDFLNLENEEKEGEIATMGDTRRRESCLSYGAILSRWLRRRRKENGSGESVGWFSLQKRCSMNCSSEQSIAEERKGDCEVGDSGRYRKETSFHLGVGFGLIYLMAISRNELKETIELRKQIETLLHKGKQELHLHTKTLQADQASNNMAYSTTDVEESVNNSDSFLTKEDSESHISPYNESKAKRKLGFDTEECFDQLEAEFETEMESLQLCLDSDYSPLDPHTEVAVPEEGRHSDSFVDVNDPQDLCTEGDCGVSPYELNVKLHELLQEKQEERIRELEAALGRAKQKLREKEMEKCWWKETAQLISKRALKS